MAGLPKDLGYRERPSLKEGSCSFLYIRLLITDYLNIQGAQRKAEQMCLGALRKFRGGQQFAV